MAKSICWRSLTGRLPLIGLKDMIGESEQNIYRREYMKSMAKKMYLAALLAVVLVVMAAGPVLAAKPLTPESLEGGTVVDDRLGKGQLSGDEGL